MRQSAAKSGAQPLDPHRVHAFRLRFAARMEPQRTHQRQSLSRIELYIKLTIRYIAYGEQEAVPVLGVPCGLA
jgi:hypothetical protein